MATPTKKPVTQAANIVASSDRARAIYNDILRMYGKEITATQGYLRLERAVDAALNVINFPVLENDQPALRGSENRLALTDVFWATEMVVNIYKVLTADEAATPFGSPLDTWPNPTLYTGAIEARALQYIYNGNTTIKIDNYLLIDSLDNMRFYRVGIAQAGLEVSVGAAFPAYLANQWDSASYGYYPLTPSVIFSGTAKNKVSINLPDTVNMAGTASTNYVVVQFRGILLQNASGFYKEMQAKPGRY